MNPADRHHLKRILASFDEAGLIALANKGLVRRATKDLETGGVQIEERETYLLVRGPGWTVTMPPEGPRHARDDTKATGITRQILMATIYLRDHWIVDEPPSAVADESAVQATAEHSAGVDLADLERTLAELSPEQLQKWAGKEIIRDAWRLVQTPPRLEIERRADLALRLLDHDVEVRLFPGDSTHAILDQAIATAPRAARKRWVLVAVLAFQQHLGKTVAAPTARAPIETDGAPRDRAHLLAVAAELLESMVGTGLSHASERSSERLLTLSISALGLNLPRLSRLLRAAADELNLLIDRDAQADTARLLETLALAHALVLALRSQGAFANADLVGRHRTEYEPVGDLSLIGVAAFPWRSGSGFEGLTVLFWDEVARAFRSWTHSRPMATRGRSPLDQVYRLESSWSGGGAPEKLARSRLILRSARTNANGRLSASQASRAEILGPSDPHTIDFAGRAFASWARFAEFVRTPFPLGLAESNPLDRFVVLRPKVWGERVFDELHQRLVWPLFDDQTQPLLATLPWTEINEPAIEFLERVQPDRDKLTAMLVRLHLGAAGLEVEPVALMGEGNPVGHCLFNPAFDLDKITGRQSGLLKRLREKFGRDRLHATLSPDDDLEVGMESIGSWELFPPGLRSPLIDLSKVLLRRAETGVRRKDDASKQQLDKLLAHMAAAGLDAFEPLPATTGSQPSWLLRCVFVLRLYRESHVREVIAL